MTQMPKDQVPLLKPPGKDLERKSVSVKVCPKMCKESVNLSAPQNVCMTLST